MAHSVAKRRKLGDDSVSSSVSTVMSFLWEKNRPCSKVEIQNACQEEYREEELLKVPAIKKRIFSLSRNEKLTIYWVHGEQQTGDVSSCPPLSSPESLPLHSTTSPTVTLAEVSDDPTGTLRSPSNHLSSPSTKLMAKLKRSRPRVLHPSAREANLRTTSTPTVICPKAPELEQSNIGETARKLRQEIYQRQKKVNQIKQRKDEYAKKMTALTKVKDFADLEELIRKWRGACQSALHDLCGKAKQQPATIGDMLKHFDIEPQILNYDPDSDGFK